MDEKKGENMAKNIYKEILEIYKKEGREEVEFNSFLTEVAFELGIRRETATNYILELKQMRKLGIKDGKITKDL